MKEIREAEKTLEQARQACEEYYCNNYERCMAFLPKHWRYIKDIDAFIKYVESGEAQTLKDAIELRSAVLREIDKMRERREEREERERQHRETQEKLSKVKNRIKHYLTYVKWCFILFIQKDESR